MKRGCLYGLGCLVAIATSWIWVPALLAGLVFLLSLAEALLARV